MRSLFWKIFLWFWGAMAMVVLVIAALVFITQQRRFDERENQDANRRFGGRPRPEARAERAALGVHLQAAAILFEREGKSGLESYLKRLYPSAVEGTFVFQEDETVFLWRTTKTPVPDELQNLARNAKLQAQTAQAQTVMAGSYLLGAQKAKNGLVVAAIWDTRQSDGRADFRRNGPPNNTRSAPDNGPLRRRSPFGPPFFLWDILFGEPSPLIQAVRLLVISGTTGLVCFGLVRHLTTPIFQLRAATRRLANGDLAARVEPSLGKRRDELGVLGRDFDQMAERLESLVGAQNQLIADISHELRSPLARLNVALELVRAEAGPGAKEDLDRIAQESERLNAMIGQLLTLSRLETRLENDETLREKSPLPLKQMIQAIAADADFEARSRHCRVQILKADDCQTQGDGALLQSALENIVRNATRYAPENSTVEMTLECNEKQALIRVRDHGPGVPAEALPHLLLPFYRVTEARDRQSGGTGLGLAIADRAIRYHGGAIEIKNADPGLLVEVRLPLG